ncbi:MAG TPA: alpha/beta hydrolase [Solirubrobacteraceae bacterium]|jgi:pimeloyl-ACP methyl ester carboxylesterase|nr:alpha/beta hydrolase [Solirubrobacteraceae bacterium]
MSELNRPHRAAAVQVIQQGSGPDVLLLAGLAEGSAAWERPARSLAGDFRLTRYDGRGPAGLTAPGPHRLRGLVDDAVAALDLSGVERAHIVGASLGGVVAQQLALAHPERVRTLTLVSTWARADRALRALFSTWRAAAEQARSVGDLLHIAYSSTHSTAAWNDRDVDGRIAAVQAAAGHDERAAWRGAREAFIWTLWAAEDHDTRTLLAAVDAPALVVAGEQDRLLSPAHGRELSELLPRASLSVIAGAGHRPFDDQPEAFDRLLGDFLRSSDRRLALAA